MTGQRRIIARVLSIAKDHPDVEEVYRRAHVQDSRISLSTVYRTIKLFDRTLQPAPQWQLSLRPSYDREVTSQQYVTTSATGGAATFGARYVFAFVDRTTLSTQARRAAATTTSASCGPPGAGRSGRTAPRARS